MQIQINTDSSVKGTEQLGAAVKAVVENTIRPFSDRITRVEVHLSDESGHRNGPDAKRCMMEARCEGHQPIAVTQHAATLDQAIDGAAGKLKHALESLLRPHDHR